MAEADADADASSLSLSSSSNNDASLMRNAAGMGGVRGRLFIMLWACVEFEDTEEEHLRKRRNRSP